jgi:hypothetical protein
MFDESFRKNQNITKVADKVFIYKNFITGDLLNNINEISKKFIDAPAVTHNIDWYHSRTTPLMFELIEVWEKASDLIYPELVMHPQACMLISRTGEEGMFVHSDAPGDPHEDCGSICGTCDIAGKNLVSEDRWNTCCRLHYGLVIYFGDWEGGEIFYPHVNKNGEWIGKNEPYENGEELIIKPENGDLVIHGAHNDYAHGTLPVTKGTRFAFSNFVLPSHTNPGTFYNYNSAEYNEQIKKTKEEKNLTHWMKTVNGYVWQDPPKVVEEKQNGINGVRYR